MGIKLRFERPFVRDNTNRIVANESELVQQANLIASKVSQTDFNGNTISSLINQTSTTIKIQAEKIQLEGIVTANSNFKVLLDGSIEAVNAKLSGSITATKMVSPSGTSYFAEVGVTGGIAGLGLFDTRYGSTPYFRVVEEILGTSFAGFSFYDDQGRRRMRIAASGSFLYGLNEDTYISVSQGAINFIVNGVLREQWT